MPETKWIGCGKYNSGRGGYRVKQIVPHIAECPTMAGVDATLAGTREASAHYCVDDTSIHQYVAESDTAWAVGNWVGNRETISIEHVGTTANPPSRKTLDRSAELMADIARRYGWSELVLGGNVGLHKWYSATSCPAMLGYTTSSRRRTPSCTARRDGTAPGRRSLVLDESRPPRPSLAKRDTRAA